MKTPSETDHSHFPDPTYARTVLAPLYDHAKALFGEPLMRINRAHCVMLAETGVLPEADAARIAAALNEIESSTIWEPSEYTGDHEDLFFEVEAALKQILGSELGGSLHTARSRNDLDHAILRIQLKSVLDEFLTKGRALARTMLDTAHAGRDEIIVAYTHGQPAQPSTYGHYISAALETLLRDLERLEAARIVVDQSPMGAAAITTTGFAIDRHRVAELIGFAGPTRNSYASIAGVDYITAPYSALSLAMLHLGRLIQDFQYWTAFEVGQLYVNNALVQISSIMPQKRNPVPIEHMRHLASTASGQATTVVQTMHNTPFTDMNDSESEVQITGTRAFHTAGRVVDLMAAFLDGAQVQPDNVRRNIDRACITITELADTLVRAEKLSFRQAHEVATAVARAVVAANGALSDGYAAFHEAFSRHTGKEPSLNQEAFRAAVSPEHFVAVRSRFGGPAPEAMEEALSAYSETLQSLEDRAAANHKRHLTAAKLLQERFDALRALAEEE